MKQPSLMCTMIVLNVLDYIKYVSHGKHVLKYLMLLTKLNFLVSGEERKRKALIFEFPNLNWRKKTPKQTFCY